VEKWPKQCMHMWINKQQQKNMMAPGKIVYRLTTKRENNVFQKKITNLFLKIW
jgi:hypothetical protein